MGRNIAIGGFNPRKEQLGYLGPSSKVGLKTHIETTKSRGWFEATSMVLPLKQLAAQKWLAWGSRKAGHMEGYNLGPRVRFVCWLIKLMNKYSSCKHCIINHREIGVIFTNWAISPPEGYDIHLRLKAKGKGAKERCVFRESGARLFECHSLNWTQDEAHEHECSHVW